MESVDNSLTVLLLALAVVFLILTLLFLVRFLVTRRTLRARNRAILTIMDEKESIEASREALLDKVREDADNLASLRDQLASGDVAMRNARGLCDATVLAYRDAMRSGMGSVPDVEVDYQPLPAPDPTPVPVTEEDANRAAVRKLVDGLKTTGLFRDPSAGVKEVASMMGLDRKGMDAMLKASGITLESVLDRLRLDEARVKLVALKDYKPGQGEPVPEEEDTIEEIAELCGFGRTGAMKRAVKRRYGMSFDEYWDAL